MVAVAARTPRRRWLNLFEQQRFLAAVLIAPAVLFITVLIGGHCCSRSTSASRTRSRGWTGEYVGLDNFRHAWEDPNFRRAIRNTVLFRSSPRRSCSSAPG